MRSLMNRKHCHHLLVGCAALTLLWVTGCDLDLGEIPFECNKGEPKCPGGYYCQSNVCLREGECPARIKGCPQPPPRGRFCNGLEKTGGVKFNMILKVGDVSLKALTGQCSACANLPEGKSSLTLSTEGEPNPDMTGTVTMSKGKQYIFWSSLNDAKTEMELDGGELKPEYRCETSSPFE